MFFFFFFFFNDTATTEIYTLSLHDALPISVRRHRHALEEARAGARAAGCERRQAAGGLQRGRRGYPRRGEGLPGGADRKSTRLNSSHLVISYAVFCLKKKKKNKKKRHSQQT